MENISKGRKVNQYPSCALAKSGNEWLQRNVISTIILLVLATAHVSSDAISKRERSLPGAEFINGLAKSMRRIHSSKLATISKNSPFQLEFRTECPSSNLIFNEKFVIRINRDGNLAYLNKENNETKVYSRVANGQWHALNFNGSAITFLGSYDQSLSETTYSEIPILYLTKLNENEHSEESVHDLLYFFDGFVGCVRINTENSTVANVLYHPSSEIDTNTDGHIGDDEFGHAVDDHSNESEVNVSSIFQLFTIFSGCTDLNHDLKDSHHCHNPDSFVYCEKCKGKCVEKGTDQNKQNECNCTNTNSEGTHCEISVKESAEPVHEVISWYTDPATSSKNSSLLPENSLHDTSVLTTPASTTTPLMLPVQAPSDMPVLPVTCPCENGGFCTSHDVDARCNCPSGFYGEHCEKILCSSSTCVEGVCQNGQCYCTPGYTGNHCEIDINECNPDPCYKNWTDHCEQGINRFTCMCLPGFTSKLCDVNIDECAPVPCQNGATCIDGINAYTCKCVDGFNGVNCENNIDECTVDGDEPKCFNNGTCIDKINGFDCNCTNTGFDGARCEQNIDDCLHDSCQHGGTCVDQINGYLCSCHHGYYGYNCGEDIKECAPHNNSSSNGSLITNNTSPCVEGSCFEFSNESLYDRTAWEHGNIPKEFRIEFSYANASGFFCQCPDGFEGLNCEINLNECELVAGTHPCIHGKCIDGRNNYTCECKPGYTSRNCEIDIDECKSSPCAQGGKCIDQIADFECKCPDGYGSKDCSIALTGCMPQNPCLNSGNCTPDYVNHQQVFNCSCPNGFSGQLCEILTTMSFNGSNYLTVSSNDDNYKNGTYEMEFRFKTTLSNVLVAVGQGTTYFMLTLADGRLNLQSSLLNSLNGISSGLNLSNAVWHKAWILVNESHISLAANSEQTIHPINNEDGTQGQTGFNMTVLGGATPPLNFLNKELVGFFVGCVQDVKINGKQIVVPKDKNTNITVVNDVGIGCTRKEQCKPLNPCLNGGRCTDLWQKYQCQCLRPFLGYKCEFQYQPGTFGNENTTMSIAEVIIPPEVSRKFSNSFDISMFVRTRESRGTIFFLGDDTRENGFFIQAQVEEDGQLGVVSKLDEAKEETYTVGGLQINNGFPYLISVQKEKGLVKISINKTEHFRKSVKEKIQFSPTIMLIGGVLPHNSDLNESNDFEDSTLLPGVDAPARVFPTLSSSFKIKQFKGVIQDVRVNLSSTDVTPSSSSHNHFVVEFFPLNVTMKYSMGESLGHVNLHGEVLEGVISDQTCTSSPCLNGGTCVVTWNDFECGCVENVYAGKTCDVLLRCAMVTCPKQSQCRNINATGFECIAEVALDGRGTVSPHYRLKSNDTENLNFNAISFRYRSRSGGSIIYLSGGTSTLRVALEYDAYIRDGIEDADRSNFLSVYFNSTRYNFNVLTGLDGDWHSVELGFASNNFTLKYDGVHLDKGKMADFHMSPTFFNDIVSSHAGQIIVGSYIREGNEYNHVADTGPLQTSLIHHMESLHDAFFKGCLADVKIGNYELPFVSPELLYEANENNISLVETTAPTAFYIENSVSLHLGCILCYEDECRNGGKCENAPAVYDCACKDGYTGSICQTNIDECVSNICAQGSSCMDQVANYTCECSKGYAGWLCDEDEDECNSSPCKHGGFCINLPADSGFYKCNCTDDYTGDNCERRKLSTCQNENEPCENGAKCRTVPIRPDGVSFVCECPTGYEGTVCEKQIDYCANVTCANGGTCNNALVGFQCLCMPGWDGPKCETDRNECTLPEYKGVPPCQNNGTCIDGINEFTCNCSGTGFAGEYCEVDVDECENYHVQEECFQSFSKICVNTPGSYECNCPPALCGTRCNISNPCQKLKSNETCKNGGRCMPMCDDDPDKWMCRCSEGFEGQTCATTLSSTREQTLNIALIVIPVLTAFLLASVIAIFILVKMARKKRATRGVYSPSQQEYCNPRTAPTTTATSRSPGRLDLALLFRPVIMTVTTN